MLPMRSNGCNASDLDVVRRSIERGWMMTVAFAGAFSARLVEPVRARLSQPCEVSADDEAGIVSRLNDVDVLVSMGFTAHMTAHAPRLRSGQGPGAGVARGDMGAGRQ